MSSVLRSLTDSVGRRPVVTILLVLLVTGALASRAPEAELVNDNAAFSPETPEVLASQELRERFSDSATASLQVVVSGEDVVSADGVTTVDTVVSVAEDVFGDALVTPPDSPGVVSFLTPAAMAAQAGGVDLSAADDTTVDQLQQRALSGPPPGAAASGSDGAAPGGAPAGGAPADIGELAVQLTAGEDPTDAGDGLVLLQIDRDAYEDDLALVEAQNDYADELLATATPLDATPFSFELISQPDEDFQVEIRNLGIMAALVILVVLAFVLRARRGSRLGWGGALRRSLADMGMSLLTVFLAVAWVQGLVVVLGPDYLGIIGQASPPTQIVPILLLALGVDYAIHVQARYREELGEGIREPAELVRALGPSVGVALLLSMITTSVGFLTNLFSPIPAIRDLGVLAAAGILSAFVLSLTFLPAVRSLLDRRAVRRDALVVDEVAPHEGSVFTQVAMTGLKPALNHPVVMLSLAGLLAVAGAVGLTQLDTEFDVTAFLPEDSPQVDAFRTLTEEFDGGLAESTEVLVTGDVLDPAVHNATGVVLAELEGADGIVTLGGGPAVTSPVTVLATLAPADDAQSSAVEEAVAAGLQPDGTVAADADMTAVYEPLVAVFPGVAGVVDLGSGAEAAADGPDASDAPAGPALRVAVRTQSESVGVAQVDQTVTAAVAPLREAGADTVVTSDAIINVDILESLSDSQVRGLAITVVAVMLLLGLVYGVRSRQPGLGVLVMLPVLAVVLWTFGLMVLTGIPFDPVTAVISALVIGVGVDFCIHLGERFVEDAERHDWDVDHALRSSLHHTGAALTGSGATTILGFSVLTTASIVPFQRLGTVTIYAVGLSLVATLFVLPPLLVLYGRWHRRRNGHATTAAGDAGDTELPVDAGVGA